VSNLFDGLESTAHSIIVNAMGYVATWKKQDGSSQVATILLNRPTQKAVIGDLDYDAISPKMEYLEGDFEGLFDAVRGGGSEQIYINGYLHYTIKADRKFDGKTIIINLTPGEKVV
jgi:hypothetical protein